jgi:hypothetical protein
MTREGYELIRSGLTAVCPGSQLTNVITDPDEVGQLFRYSA